MAVPAVVAHNSFPQVVPAGGDTVVINDASDAGNTKTALISEFSTALGLLGMALQAASAVSITGGSLDSVTITNVVISSGSINGTSIGVTARAAGNFTAVNVTNDLTAGGTITATNFVGDGSALSNVVPTTSWQGQWLTGTVYNLFDEVFNLGSSYIATVAGTSGASTEPGVGAAWTERWDLRTSPGTGDVTGPGASVGDTVALFDGVSGKLLSDSGRGLGTASGIPTLDANSLVVQNPASMGAAGGVAIPVISDAGIRAQVGGAGKTLFYVNTDIGGELYYSATDPYGNGDTGFMAWAASGGGFWVRPWTGSVSVKWFGAVGDSVTDDSGAFNAADLFVEARGGGTVLIPPLDGGYYLILLLTLVHNKVRFKGFGPASWVHNGAVAQPHSFTLSPGWVHETSWERATGYDISPITKGVGTVTLTTPADSSNFAVDEVVWVVAYDDGTPGFNASFAEMRRIKAIDGITGVIKVDYGFIRDVPVPSGVTPRLVITKLADALLNGLPCFISDGSGLSNFRISSDTGNTLRSSCYQGVFEDMVLDSPAESWFGNGMGHCTCRNIKAFTGTGLEIAEGSHDNLYEDIEVTFREGGSASSGTMLVLRHNSTFINLKVNGGSAVWAQLLKFRAGGGVVHGGYARGKCTTKPVEMSYDGSLAAIAVRNKLLNFTFDLLGTAPLQLAVLEGNAEMKNCTFRDFSTASMNQIATVSNTGNDIRDNRFLMGGVFKDLKMSSTQTATLNILTGNYFQFPEAPFFGQVDYETNQASGNFSDATMSGYKAHTELQAGGNVSTYTEILLDGNETANQSATLPAADLGQRLIARNLSTTFNVTLTVKNAGTELIKTTFSHVGATTLVLAPGEIAVLSCAADLTWYATRLAGSAGGVSDGDKGDIVVSGSGVTWLFDPTVVTAFAKTFLDDANQAAVQTTLGIVLDIVMSASGTSLTTGVDNQVTLTLTGADVSRVALAWYKRVQDMDPFVDEPEGVHQKQFVEAADSATFQMVQTLEGPVGAGSFTHYVQPFVKLDSGLMYPLGPTVFTVTTV